MLPIVVCLWVCYYIIVKMETERHSVVKAFVRKSLGNRKVLIGVISLLTTSLENDIIREKKGK